MKKLYQGQRVMSVVYTIMAVVVFLYSLVFMTEYNDLFGLKLPQNQDVARFYEGILQSFNRQILVWVIVGVIGILVMVMLEIRTKVPDRFSAVVMVVYMAACCYGSVDGIRNILAIQAYYQGLDFQYLPLEGVLDYQLKLGTFQVGMGIYPVYILVCVAFATVLVLSHIKYKKLEKGGI